MSSRRRSATKARGRGPSNEKGLLDGVDASLLDIVDHVLTKGIVLTGDLVLGVADIDLVYLRLSALLCAADRVLGPAARSRKEKKAREEPLARPLIAGKLGIPRMSGAPRHKRSSR